MSSNICQTVKTKTWATCAISKIIKGSECCFILINYETKIYSNKSDSVTMDERLQEKHYPTQKNENPA